eukprot:m.163867 g.163867  ORF g.163867 m.163867 type:complete len:503 (-) comp15222_c0_seq11:63-1571(-)
MPNPMPLDERVSVIQNLITQLQNVHFVLISSPSVVILVRKVPGSFPTACSKANIVVKEKAQGIGTGIYSTEKLQQGTTVWSEKPLYGVLQKGDGCAWGLQQKLTAGTCCEQCGTFLGTMQLQLHLHAGNVTAKDISKALKQNDATTLTQYLLEPVLPCINQEDCTLTHDIVPSKSDYAEFPLFCSESCRLYWENNFGKLMSSKAAGLLHSVADDFDCGFVIMVAKLLSVHANLLEKGDKANLDLLTVLCGAEYQQCINQPKNLEERLLLAKKCNDLCERTSAILTDYFQSNSRLSKDHTTTQGISMILGQLCRNCILVTYTNPIHDYLALVSQTITMCAEANKQEMQSLKDLVQQIAVYMNKEQDGLDSTTSSDESEKAAESDDEGIYNLGDGVLGSIQQLIPCFQGWAVYSLLSNLNHTCAPNCEPEFPNNSSTVSLETRERIEEGGELCISYVDVDIEEQERSKQLVSYGFTCACSRCMQDRDEKKDKMELPQEKKQRNS